MSVSYPYVTRNNRIVKERLDKFNNIVGKEHFQEVFTYDDAFDFSEFFSRKMPGDVMFANGFGNQKYNAKIVKENIVNKLGLYAERIQKSLHLATQKYIGSCEEQKVIKNLFKLSTKIIATSTASVFIGEVSSKL